jgi:hypothetical protein
MPRLRLPRRISDKGRPRSSGRIAAGLLLGAALYALAELAAGLLIGRFFDWGRAEAALFFAFRPWLLLIAALRMAEWEWRGRYALFALSLLLAGVSESLFLIGMGAIDPWPEMLRGLAAGALLVLMFDLVIQLGCRRVRRWGKLIATVLLAVLMLIPGALTPYERIALGRIGSANAPLKPPLLVMTSLPIIWGEGGPFDAASRPAASWIALQQEFEPQPLDYLDEKTLAPARLMLIAQPRQLAPEELVALDSWVRRGGRALILADPALLWPSDLPVGDARRPVSTNMLTPLLTHWGIAVEPPERAGVQAERLDLDGSIRQLQLAGAGRLRLSNAACRLEAPFAADCHIGLGRATVVADADLLHDATSLPGGSDQLRRHTRLSDNVVAVVDWLDRLAGVERDRAMPPVQWAAVSASRSRALMLAAAPILVLCLMGIIVGLFRRIGNSLTYPQGNLGRKSARTGRTNHE